MRCAIIGSSGHAGYLLAGLRPGVDFVAAVAPGRCGEAAAPVKGAKVYENALTMLDAEKPQAVAVNTWFCDQAKWIVECLNRGIAVLAEKPLALNLEDLARVEQAAKQDPRLAAMMGIRYEPWFMAAKRAVEDGVLGDIRLADGQKSYKMGTRGPHYQHREDYGGTIPWVALHALDWVNWMLDAEPVSVAAAHSAMANGGNGDMEATAAMLFTYPGQRIATIRADFMRPDSAPRHDDDALRLTGTKGTLVLRDQVATVQPMEGEAYTLEQRPEDGIGRRFLLDAEDGGFRSPTAEESIRATRWAILARTAADEGRVIQG